MDTGRRTDGNASDELPVGITVVEKPKLTVLRGIFVISCDSFNNIGEPKWSSPMSSLANSEGIPVGSLVASYVVFSNFFVINFPTVYFIRKSSPPPEGVSCFQISSTRKASTSPTCFTNNTVPRASSASQLGDGCRETSAAPVEHPFRVEEDTSTEATGPSVPTTYPGS